MKTEIAECCKKLRLSKNIAVNCEQLEAESHQEYLLKVLQNELEYRQTARKNRLINKRDFTALNLLTVTVLMKSSCPLSYQLQL